MRRGLIRISIGGVGLWLALGTNGLARPTEGASAPPPGVVRVLDEAGQPVPQAAVRLVPCDRDRASARILQGTTDAEGRAEFSDASGRYDVLAWDETRSRVGLQECSSLKAGVTLTLRLQKAGVIEGEVVSETGVAPAGGVVRAFHLKLRDRWSDAMTYDREPLFAWTTPLDREGRFRVSGLLPGAYRLMVHMTGYTGVPGTATVAAGQTARVRLRVIRGGAQLTVRAVDMQDRPVPNARVSLLPAVAGNPSSRLWSILRDQVPVTDAEGQVTLYGLPSGVDFRLLVRAPGRGVQLTEALRLSSGESARRTVRLVPGHEIVGVAVDEDGDVLRNVRATVRLLEGPVQWRLPLLTEWQAPDEKGRFRVGLVPSVPVEVVFQASGYRSVRQELRLAGAGERHDLGRVVFRRGATIEGRVVDDTGRPVPNARITATPLDGVLSIGALEIEATSGSDGTFVIGGLEADVRYELRASATGYAQVGWGSVRVAANSKGVVLTLARQARVRGRVVTADKKPIPFFYVRAFTSPEGVQAFVAFGGADEPVFDVQGSFDREVAPGVVWIQIEAPDHGVRELSVSVRPGESKDLGEIVVDRGCLVQVHVRDASGQPVPLATVVSVRRTEGRLFSLGGRDSWKVTDERGDVPLGTLMPGRYEVTVSHPDFAIAVQRIEVSPACEVQPTEIVLKPGGRLRVCVLGEQEAPVAGALVRVLWQNPEGGLDYSLQAIPLLTTDASGCVTTPLLAEGAYRVTAATEAERGFQRPAPVQVEVRAGELRDVLLRACAFRLTGRILYGTTPLTTGTLNIVARSRSGQSPGAPSWARVSLKGDPTFQVCTQPADRYRFFYESLDGTQVNGEIQVGAPAEASEASVEIRLPPTRMDVQVVRADTGAPLEGAGVSIRPSAASASGVGLFWAACSTRPDGTCSLIGFSTGPTTLTVVRPGYARFEQTWDDPQGIPPTLRVELTTGGTLRGKILDMQGRPVQGEVQVYDARQGSYLQSGAGMGEYTVYGLPMGVPLNVVTSADGYAPSFVEGLTVAQETAFVDFRLSLGAPLRVQVIDAQGRPVAGARVTLRSPGGLDLTYFCGPRVQTVLTDEQGFLEFRRVPTQGGIIVEAQKEGRRGQASVAPVEGVPAEVRVILPEK
ncbi:hypothetical protein HRbin11_00540 [bacterium HR11]|nr:hypothetical protein HRbin11_00540 [bacterium HR11]